MLFINKRYFVFLLLLFSSKSFSGMYKIKCERKKISTVEFIKLAKSIDSKFSNFESKRLLAKSYILASVWNSLEYCEDDIKNKKIPRLYSELSYGSWFLSWGYYENNPDLPAGSGFTGYKNSKTLKHWKGSYLAPISNKKLLIEGLAILKKLKKNYPFNGDPKKSWSYVDNLTLAWVYENLEDYKNAIKFYSVDYKNKHGCISGAIECYSSRPCIMKKIVLEAFSSQIRIYTKTSNEAKVLDLKEKADFYRKNIKDTYRPRLRFFQIRSKVDRDC